MERKTLRKKKEKIVGNLPDLAETVRGSIVKRFLPCGKIECRCRRGQGHGPYYYLMTTIKPGKTRMVLVSKDQLPLVRLWVKNFKLYKKGLEKIADLNIGLLHENRKAITAKRRRRNG